MGDDSFAWSEAAAAWGGSIEVIVHRHRSNHRLRGMFKLPASVSAASVLSSSLSTGNVWGGVMLATIRDQDTATDAGALFEAWRPRIAILALPTELSRRKRIEYSSAVVEPAKRLDYNRLIEVPIRHGEVGGVTSTIWKFTYLTRDLGSLSKEAIMIAPQFQRPLQTALDDTQGPPGGKAVVFEEASDSQSLRSAVAGFASVKGVVSRVPVYDAKKVGPDLERLAPPERSIWVLASSVFRKGGKVVRPVNEAEQFSIWDYDRGNMRASFGPTTKAVQY